jgi:phosphomannomutase
MTKRLACFKAYDVRGKVPDELNETLSFKIGHAYAAFVRPQQVVVGHDVRLSSPTIAGALMDGLTQAGVDVLDIGLCGTEEVYFATFHLGVDGGIMVTASHNPVDYNGMKFVREDAKPISGLSGLREMEGLLSGDEFSLPNWKGNIERINIHDQYVAHLLSYLDVPSLEPFTVVTNAGNGGAGPIVDKLEGSLPVSFIKIHHHPDGNFPNGVPNPLLPENRQATSQAVSENHADIGIAWDGDYDRCFLFDERGEFIEGYYIVGLLASQMLTRYPGSKVIHDPRLTWNTIELVKQAGGIPVQSRTGHAFIKERMRLEDAVYGGEMSAHHYFRDFSYCDSGMIPWLLVLNIMSKTGKKLSELVGERMERYPTSGEINRRLADPGGALQKVRDVYGSQASAVDEMDGVSIEFASWRFNLRPSNTEPVVRLNVESRGDVQLLQAKTQEILALLDTMESA